MASLYLLKSMKKSTKEPEIKESEVRIRSIVDSARLQLRDTGQTLVVGYMYKYDRLVNETGSLSSLIHLKASLQGLKML